MAETDARKVERLLNLEPGTVTEVATRPHANGIEWCAFLKGGAWPQSRVSGLEHWSPPPFTHTVTRLVVGRKKSGEVKVGTEVVGKDAQGADIVKDVMQDTFEDVLEDDATVSQRVDKDARAEAKAKGWRTVSVGAATLLPKTAAVVVTCG